MTKGIIDTFVKSRVTKNTFNLKVESVFCRVIGLIIRPKTNEVQVRQQFRPYEPYRC